MEFIDQTGWHIGRVQCITTLTCFRFETGPVPFVKIADKTVVLLLELLVLFIVTIKSYDELLETPLT